MASSHNFTDPELAVLISACAPSPREHAETRIDWPRLIRLARFHRVYPRLWARYGEQFPQDHAVSMRAMVAENSISALRNVARTIETVQTLREAGIEALVLKGPLLAHDLYGDIALRVAGDVDLLVQEQNFLRAAQVLAARGYRPEVSVNADSLRRLQKRQHDLGLAHPEDDTLIELHADIAQPHYGFRIDPREWWKGKREQTLGGDRVWVLSWENAYLLTALHAAKHRWHRLDLISDMAAFAGQHGIDRGYVHSRAAQAWLLRHVQTGEEISAWLIGQKTPSSPLGRRAISQVIAERDFGRWGGIWFDVGLRERTADKAGYLWRRLLSAMPGL